MICHVQPTPYIPYFSHVSRESPLFTPHSFHQTEGAAHLQLISKDGLKRVLSVPHTSKRSKLKPKEKEKGQEKENERKGEKEKEDLLSGPTPMDLGPQELARIELANKAFRRYAELQTSLSHTRCCKLRLSYRGAWYAHL